MTVTLAIVDDDGLWLDLLEVALSKAQMEVIASFRSASAATASWPSEADVALIDVDLGPESVSGFELARQLRSRWRGLGVVFLTSVLDPWLFDAAAASALAGTSYLLKGSVASLETLTALIRAAARGDVTVDPAIAEAVNGGGPLPGLNAVQVRILRLMAIGKTNSEIAADLRISLKTVEANITKTARILGVSGGSNVRVGCVTHYLSAAVAGAHGAVRRRPPPVG